MRLAIVGSREYDKKLKIKEFIYELREKEGDDLEIVSGGCKTGADRLAKQCCNELEVKYVEFPPAHFPHNQYCVLGPFKYGKQYAVWHYFERNKQIVEYSDYVVAFIPEGVVSNGTNNTIEHANKLEKKVIIIN